MRKEADNLTLDKIKRGQSFTIRFDPCLPKVPRTY